MAWKQLHGLLMLAAWFAILVVFPEVGAGHVKRPYDANYKAIRELLQQPEHSVDIAAAKLTVDQMIDPSFDKAGVLKQIDAMAREARSNFPVAPTNLAKFKALRDYLYQPPFPSARPAFGYNLEEDRNPRSKLLPVYLATRKGNCVSMPLLVVALAQRLDIPVALVAAPAHLYVKFRGDDGRWYGVETTSGGGWADDEWQRKQFPTITDTAVANGVYLRPLSKRETLAVIAEALLESYEGHGTVASDEARVKLALLLLEHHPTSIPAMAHAYFGYLSLRQRLFDVKYAQPTDIPAHLQGRYRQLEEGWSYWGRRAKALGYVPPTPEFEAAYRERIRQARASLQRH